MIAPRIPTEAQWYTEILGAIGQGPKDRMGILGPMASHGYSFPHCEPAIDAVLAAMVTKGLVEAVAMPSQYAAGVTWTAWRLPASTPMESPAAPEESSATRAGHISIADFRAQGGKRKGGRG